MHKIKFSRCPIGRHEGERWTKLEKVDTSKPVYLFKIRYEWAKDFWRYTNQLPSNEYIGNAKEDTFSDFTYEEWKQLICTFYNTEDVFGMVLYFSQEHPEGRLFTTFRAYDVRKAAYYERCVGEEFMVEEVE